VRRRRSSRGPGLHMIGVPGIAVRAFVGVFLWSVSFAGTQSTRRPEPLAQVTRSNDDAPGHKTSRTHQVGCTFLGVRGVLAAAAGAGGIVLGVLSDFVAVSMLSVDVPAEAAIRLLGPDAGRVADPLSQIPTDVDIIDVNQDMLCGDSAARRRSGLRSFPSRSP
jgi:hypothetical protein